MEDERYKIFTIRFHKDKDAELIAELEKKETSKRAWLHDLYYEKPKIPTDLCSIAEVERLMMMYRIPRLTRINIIEALRKQCED